jgi:hypothetical protein
MTMRPERQAQDWNELAQLDPYWAILTTADKRFGGWNNNEFFDIGIIEVAALMKHVERLGHRISANARSTSAAV